MIVVWVRGVFRTEDYLQSQELMKDDYRSGSRNVSLSEVRQLVMLFVTSGTDRSDVVIINNT